MPKGLCWEPVYPVTAAVIVGPSLYCFAKPSANILVFPSMLACRMIDDRGAQSCMGLWLAPLLGPIADKQTLFPTASAGPSQCCCALPNLFCRLKQIALLSFLLELQFILVMPTVCTPDSSIAVRQGLSDSSAE